MKSLATIFVFFIFSVYAYGVTPKLIPAIKAKNSCKDVFLKLAKHKAIIKEIKIKQRMIYTEINKKLILEKDHAYSIFVNGDFYINRQHYFSRELKCWANSKGKLCHAYLIQNINLPNLEINNAKKE